MLGLYLMETGMCRDAKLTQPTAVLTCTDQSPPPNTSDKVWKPTRPVTMDPTGSTASDKIKTQIEKTASTPTCLVEPGLLKREDDFLHQFILVLVHCHLIHTQITLSHIRLCVNTYAHTHTRGNMDTCTLDYFFLIR